jgi:prepilin-type N-terminal cleavage/methylation domain-containing protein
MNNKGFTLIELLTVIAIIAILAAITLVTFPVAQSRAKDARTINAMQQLRVAAEASRGAYGDYRQVKETGSADPTIVSLVAEINDNAQDLTMVPAAPTTKYCAEATLQAGGRTWCIDSAMFSGYDQTCNAVSYVCE